MSKEYKVEREYSFAEIVRYNLRKWWLAVIFAVLCAAALGGYKYHSLKPYVENEAFSEKFQVQASLFVSDYSDENTVERAGNIIKIASSSKAYEKFCENTDYVLPLDNYQNVFKLDQTEVSDVVTVYVTYPVSYGEFALADEQSALTFTEALLKNTIQVADEVIGKKSVTLLDAPHSTHEVEKLQSYMITNDDFEKAVRKGIAAGVLLGIIVEVVLYTVWMLLYKKPKNAEEIRQCMDADIIDVIKNGRDDEEIFRKVALYLKNDENTCNRISCLSVKNPKTDTALKLALSYANEQKKTLYVDLTGTSADADEKSSISAYVLGKADSVTPHVMNAYLDSVHRNEAEEKDMNIAGNKRFAAYLDEMCQKYECIVINTADVTKAADGYIVSALCDRTVAVCGRKAVNNETLYKVKNTAAVNGIEISGVLVYEL